MAGLVMLGDELLVLTKLSRAQFATLWDLYEIHKGGRVRYPLRCHEHGSAMYLVNHGGQLWASHYPNSGVSATCSTQICKPEGIAHEHMKEYAYRAVSNAGFHAVQEFSTGNGTRLDVAVASPVQFGVEAQFSSIKAGLAKARTTKSARAGWTPVWLPGTKPIGDSLAGLVPVLRHNEIEIDWDESVPRRGTVSVVSLRHVTKERCTAGSRWNRCPNGAKSPCGRWHPWMNDPVRGITLDSALEGIGLGEFVLLQNNLRNVYYVPKSEVAVYREMTGHDGRYEPGATPYGARSRRSKVPCSADRPYKHVCQRCGHDLLYPASILEGICVSCKPLIFIHGTGWRSAPTSLKDL